MESRVENQYLDYASWKKANIDIIEKLIGKKSNIISRFRYVLAVVDYLFEQVVNENKKLSLDEEEVFEIGYQYLFDRFNTIFMIAEHVFENNYDEMEKLAKTINLLFYIIDFIDEVDSLEGDHKAEHKKFADLENKVMESIEAKIELPDTYFALVDDISLNVFESLGHDYYGITDIFYDIAIELGLIEETDEDYYDIFNNN